MTLPKDIGKKLKEARLGAGLTQVDLAKKIGIQSNSYARIERGEAVVKLPTLRKLIKVLHLNPSDILS